MWFIEQDNIWIFFFQHNFSVLGAPKKEIYFMALIDILTNYGIKKRTAQAAKTVKHGAGAEISTVHPEQYGKRFLDFMAKAIE